MPVVGWYHVLGTLLCSKFKVNSFSFCFFPGNLIYSNQNAANNDHLTVGGIGSGRERRVNQRLAKQNICSVYGNGPGV